MDNSKLKVGIYLRISVERDAEDGAKSATERQREDCERYAANHGWDVAEVFEDADLSAFNKNVVRPAFGQMLDSLRAGDIGAVLVWKLDRLSRQQRDLGLVLDACETHGAFIASVTEPIDTRESYGQFVAELLVSQARMESHNTSVRSRRKAMELRERGAPPTNSRRAFGTRRISPQSFRRKPPSCERRGIDCSREKVFTASRLTGNGVECVRQRGTHGVLRL